MNDNLIIPKPVKINVQETELPPLEEGMSEDSVFSVSHFFDGRGRHIEHRKPICGSVPDDFVEYVGHAHQIARNPATGQNMVHPVQFPIRGVSTLAEAYAQFAKAMDDFAADQKTKMEEAMKDRQRKMQTALHTKNTGAVLSQMKRNSIPVKHKRSR